MKHKNTFLLFLALCLAGCSEKAKTYGQGCGSRPAGWITPLQGHNVWNDVIVISVASDRTLRMNNANISKSDLQANLKLARNIVPAFIIDAKFDSATDCETVEEIRQMMEQTLDCQHGQCAEGDGHWRIIGEVGRNRQLYDPEVRTQTTKTP